jgi:hypothetical protein
MIRNYLSLILAGLLIYGIVPQSAAAQTDARTEKIKAELKLRATNGQSKVVIKLKRGGQVKGYITRTSEDSFELTNYRTNQTHTIAYDDVARVKKQGLSKGVKTALGIATVAGVVVLVLTLTGKKPLGTICPLGCGPF